MPQIDPETKMPIRIKNRLNNYRKEGQSLRALAREEILNKSPYGKLAEEWFANKRR